MQAGPARKLHELGMSWRAPQLGSYLLDGVDVTGQFFYKLFPSHVQLGISLHKCFPRKNKDSKQKLETV